MNAFQEHAPIVTRLAPTPSGYLHMGNVFAFLIAWLDARQKQGKVILRIEDLDKPRCKAHLVNAMVRDLARLGLHWDNEEIMHQSLRDDAYAEAEHLLSELKLLYPCFCSRADLMASSAPHEGEHLVYAGTCKRIPNNEAQLKMAACQYSLRATVPNVTVSFVDSFQGSYKQNLAWECGDFIIRRKDGLFGYQLAVVVDDICQGVNRIVRGVDLLSSTPQQMYLRKLLTQPETAETLFDVSGGSIDLQFDEVSFGHIPLIVDAKGNRLAKRKGSTGLDSLLQTFGNVESLLGYLAFHAGLISINEPITAEQLVHEADLSALIGKTRIAIDLDADGPSLR